VLKVAEGTSMHAYIVLALLTGARTEELRALTWDHGFLKGKPDADPPQPPHIAVWRSVWRGGDAKTRKSRRSLCRRAASKPSGSSSKIRVGTPLATSGRNTGSSSPRPWASRSTLPRFAGSSIKRSRESAGSMPTEWTPRELRHSFVSLLSDRGVPLEVISRLAGHSGTAVTEEVYRKQIRPVIQTGAVIMDGTFGADPQRP
jgi:integrase